MTGVTPYLEWLLPGQRWLAENWNEEQTWEEVQPGFLAALGTDVGALNSPDMRLLQLVDYHVLELGERARETLTNESEFNEIVQQQFELWTQEQELTPAAEPGYPADYPAEQEQPAAQEQPAVGEQLGETRYVDGRGWMAWNAATGEWVDTVAPEGAQPAQESTEPAEQELPAAEAQGSDPRWVEGWGWMTLDAATGQWVVTDAPAGATEPAAEPIPAPAGAEPGAETAAPADAQPVANTEPAAETEPATTANPAPAGSPDASTDAPNAEPSPAEPLPDLAPAAADAVDTAVMEEIAPVIEEAFEGVEDLDLFSPDELQEILAAALEESGLSE